MISLKGPWANAPGLYSGSLSRIRNIAAFGSTRLAREVACTITNNSEFCIIEFVNIDDIVWEQYNYS
jgi:hypothetical protein